MALDENVRGRLENWKFWSAHAALDGQTVTAIPTEVDTIRALSAAFGDCGWFEGHLGCIVSAAVSFLLAEDPVSVERDTSTSIWRDQVREWMRAMPSPPD